MGDTLTRFGIFKGFAHTASAGNVTLMEFKPGVLDDYPNGAFVLHCNKCNVQFDLNIEKIWKQGNKVILSHISDFCAKHLHQQLVEETVIPVHPSVAEQLQELVSDTKKAVSGEDDYDSFYDGLIVYPPKVRQVSVSQAKLKWIAKMSNFNVDIQARSTKTKGYLYRAVCSKCFDTTKLDADCLTDESTSPPLLTAFCTAHRHDRTVLEEVEGRRFRNAGSNEVQ